MKHSITWNIIVFLIQLVTNYRFSLARDKLKQQLEMKKTDEMGEGGYVNDALTCSSLDITSPKEIPHGSQSGSDEFICELNSASFQCSLITIRFLFTANYSQ